MQEANKLRNTINNFLDNRKYSEALIELEFQIEEYVRQKKDDLFLLAEIAGSFISLGSEAYNRDSVNKGIKIFVDNKDILKGKVTEDSIDYCLGNGYHALYKILIQNKPEHFPSPENVNEFLFEAKQSYLKSFKKIDLRNLNNYSIQVLTNLGNNLNHSGRIVEALQLFDMVLKFNPDFPRH